MSEELKNIPDISTTNSKDIERDVNRLSAITEDERENSYLDKTMDIKEELEL